EDVSAIRFGERVSTVNGHAGGSGEESEGLPPFVRAGNEFVLAEPRPGLAPRLRRADAVEVRVAPGGVDVHHRCRGHHEGIAVRVPRIVTEVFDRVAVVADERVAPVVERHPVLPAATGRLEGSRPRIETNVLAPDEYRLGVGLIGGLQAP